MSAPISTYACDALNEDATSEGSSSAIRDSDDVDQLSTAPAPFKIWPTHHQVSMTRYATSTDSRGYIPVYEYTFNGNVIMVDSENSMVHFTGVWKALGHQKADVVRLIESEPAVAGVVRKVRGGYLKIQGTWLPYEIAEQLAKRVAWTIRHDLVPLFGPDFPDSCIAPGEPGFGQLLLSSPSFKGRRHTKDPEARTAAQAASKAAQNNSKVSTASQISASRPILSKLADGVNLRTNEPTRASEVGPARRSKSWANSSTPITRSVSNSSLYSGPPRTPGRYSPYAYGYPSMPTSSASYPPLRAVSGFLPYSAPTGRYPPPPPHYRAPSAQVSSRQYGPTLRTSGSTASIATSFSSGYANPYSTQNLSHQQTSFHQTSLPTNSHWMPMYSAHEFTVSSSSPSDSSSIDFDGRSTVASSTTSAGGESDAQGRTDCDLQFGSSRTASRIPCWGENQSATLLGGTTLRPSVSLSSLPPYYEFRQGQHQRQPFTTSPVELDFTSPVQYAPSERQRVVPRPFYYLEQRSEPPQEA